MSEPTIKRKNILEFCRPFAEGDQRLVLFRAGAGYGKSIAARQVAEFAGRPTAHVMCTSVDRSPAQFAGKLLKALDPLQPGLAMEKTLRPLMSSGTPDEALLAAKESFKPAFAALAAEPLSLLVDDVHLLNGSLSLSMLRLFYDLSPHKYGFLITSRQKLTIGENPVFSMWEGLLVNQTQLEFDKLEILELYRSHFNLDLNSAQAELLLETTEGGWPAGVVLLKGEVCKLAKGYKLKTSDESHQYFIKECLRGLPEKIVKRLALLAQLEDIPSKMLVDLGMEDVRHRLKSLRDSGLFTISYQTDDSEYFRYHHLFQDTLRSFIRENISKQNLQQFNKQACKWLEKNGKFEDSLLLMAFSKNWKQVSVFMRENGSKLLMHNKLNIVRDSLADCPEQTLLDDEWLSALYGFSILFASTTKAVTILEHAFQLARKNKSLTAELIAGLGLLNYLLLLNADLRKMRKVSHRVAHLTEKILQNDDQTVFELAAPCAFLLPPTIAYSSSNYDLSIRCTDLLKEHYSKQNRGEQPLEFFFANLYAYKFIGNTRKVIDLMQSQLFKINDVSINPSARFFIIGFIGNLYEMLGIADYYYSLVDEIVTRFPALCSDSFMVGFAKIFEMDLLLAEAKYDEVKKLAHKSLQMNVVARSPHISSLCWQYSAMAQVLSGNHDEAKKAMKKALLLRAKAGGSIFILMSHNVYAAILSLTGEHNKALRMFDCILKRSISLQDGYQRPMTYAYRANLYLDLGEPDKALTDITAMLECMREHQNIYFYYWDSGIMKRLMEFYLSRKKPTSFIKTLLRQRFNFSLLPDGSPILRLKVSLAEQKIYYPHKKEKFVDLSELPGVEAKLFKLLLVRVGRNVSIQECIEYIWENPDKMKDPRNNLYVHINKLRSRFASLMDKPNAKHYLYNRAGFLSLRHVNVDQNILEEQAREALGLIRMEHWWDAELCFQRVRRLLQEFPDGYSWSKDSKMLFTDAALTWVELAQKCRNPKTTLAAAEMGLQFDPTHDYLHKIRYRMYLELNMPAKAESAKRDYARAIGVKGRTFHEIGKSMV